MEIYNRKYCRRDLFKFWKAARIVGDQNIVDILLHKEIALDTVYEQQTMSIDSIQDTKSILLLRPHPDFKSLLIVSQWSSVQLSSWNNESKVRSIAEQILLVSSCVHHIPGAQPAIIQPDFRNYNIALIDPSGLQTFPDSRLRLNRRSILVI